MRKRIIKWLRLALKFIDIPDARLEKVKELVLVAATFKVDGQRKRAWVLNNLITAFPDSRIRDLSLLIEQVIQEA